MDRTPGGIILPSSIVKNHSGLPTKAIVADMKRQLMSLLATPEVEVGFQIILTGKLGLDYAFSGGTPYQQWMVMQSVAEDIQRKQPGGSRRFKMPGQA